VIFAVRAEYRERQPGPRKNVHDERELAWLEGKGIMAGKRERPDRS
jgi:hypothetical protein